MQDRTFTFSFNELGLTTALIEEVLGYNEGDDRSFLLTAIEETLAEAEKICEIKGQYRYFEKIELRPDSRSVFVSDQEFNVNKIVFSQLSNADSAVIFICTAGPEIGRRSRKAMMERELLQGYIYDVIGSEIVEAAVDIMEREIGNSAAEKGLKITNRYSPGYCGWDVREQHGLFTFFHDNFCGIRLTSSALMDPVKSVSGIIGIGTNVRFNQYTCRMCEMKDCLYRRLREKSKDAISE